MTTIAFDGQTLAADGGIFLGDRIAGKNVKKIFELKGGGMWAGFAGDDPVGKKRIEWLNDGADPDKFPKIDGQDCSLMLVSDSGSVSIVCAGVITDVDVPFAIGSGAEFAIGAMCAGASAMEAVEIAARNDAFTCGAIEYVTVVSPKIMSDEEIASERTHFVAAFDELHSTAKDMLSLSALARKTFK